MQNSLVQLRDSVLQQYSSLQQELACSDVIELPAGVPYMLRASAVLLKGTVKVSGKPYVEGKKSRALASFYIPVNLGIFPRRARRSSLVLVCKYSTGIKFDMRPFMPHFDDVELQVHHFSAWPSRILYCICQYFTKPETLKCLAVNHCSCWKIIMDSSFCVPCTV